MGRWHEFVIGFPRLRTRRFDGNGAPDIGDGSGRDLCLDRAYRAHHIGDRHCAGGRCRPAQLAITHPNVTLEVEVFDRQRVVLNEFATWFDDVTHQFGEQIIGIGQVFDLHLQQSPRIWV